MRLTEFIHENHACIIEDWVAFAGSLLPWAKGMTEESLRDHAEELLTAVVTDMQSSQTLEQQSAKSRGDAAEGELSKIGKKHASDRLESGISLDQLVSEFRALRASVLKRWEASQGDESGEVTRFNEAIDETLAESTSKYSEGVSNTREQFLGILGHDLRNPIGAITMGASLLLESDDPETADIAQSILNSGNRMSRMVNDLLDLTRTRLGSGIPISPKRIELITETKHVISELQIMHPGSKIQLNSPSDLYGEWDSDRLAQALSNLISNAIQYGKKGEPIVVTLAKDKDSVTLDVHNEGPQIPKKSLKTIFSPMARLKPKDRMNDTNATGLGLGLYIASEIATAHCGTIEVMSDETSGTSFKIRLPLQRAEGISLH